MTIGRRILALALTLVIVAGMLPESVYAFNTTGGAGKAVVSKDCDCGDCAHDDCSCDDHCEENHSCTCDDCGGKTAEVSRGSETRDGVVVGECTHPSTITDYHGVFVATPGTTDAEFAGCHFNPITQHVKFDYCTVCGQVFPAICVVEPHEFDVSGQYCTKCVWCTGWTPGVFTCDASNGKITVSLGGGNHQVSNYDFTIYTQTPIEGVTPITYYDSSKPRTYFLYPIESFSTTPVIDPDHPEDWQDYWIATATSTNYGWMTTYQNDLWTIAQLSVTKVTVENAAPPEPEKTYTLTINHVLAVGSKWPTGSSKPPAKTTETIAENQDYYVRPLSVPGMTATPTHHSGNIGTSDKSVTFTYSNEVTPPTAKTNLVYNGKEQTGVDSGKGYTIKDNTATDAGDYKATATLDSGYTWTDGTTDVKEISWSIAPAELTSVGVTKTLYFYDGNVHKPDVTVVRAGAITVPDTDYSLSWSNENSQEVGFYTVEATATTKNFTGTATVTYEISNGIAKVPSAKTGLVYKGWTLTGVEPGTGYTLRDNTGETAGNYIATATLEHGFEWDDGSKNPKTIPWSIAQAPITGMTLSERTFTYNGSVQRPGVTSVHAGNIRLKRIDYTISWSDENSKDVGIYTVTVRGTENFTGVITRKYVIESMETWNLFEDGSAHVYSVRGITSKNEVANSNKNSAKYFTAVLSKDKIAVSLKEGADRKKAAGTNVFDFDLGDEGAVSYTLPFTYDKPVLKLSSTKGTVKKGVETTLKTTVLVQTENGNYVPYDLTGATVTYGSNIVTVGDNGQVSIKASAKASDKLVISKHGWNEKDPVQLSYTISEIKPDKDVLSVDMGGMTQVTLSTKVPEQSFSFPLTLNGEAATASTVTATKGKKGEENLVSIGDGTLTVALGRSSIGKGSYTVNLTGGNAKLAVKIKVTDKGYSATGKIKQKYDVVTKMPMIIEPTLKEVQGTITDVSVTSITLNKGTPLPAESFEALMNNGNIEVTYTGAEEMKAKSLKIGDMTLKLTVTDSSAGGTPVEVTMLVKNVAAKKTTPVTKTSNVVIPKALAEKADGTYVIASANILSTYKDSAKHVRTIEPVSAELTPQNVVAEVDPDIAGRILIKKLNGKSGSVKVKLTYPGGVTKTITIKVSKGKK